MLMLAAAFLVCIVAHLLTMALIGRATGVTLQVIGLGTGPVVLRLGMLHLGMFPVGGHVRFLDSRMEEVPAERLKFAFDRRSPEEQILIILSGCLLLVIVASVVLGDDFLALFISAPAQVFAGAVSPFGEAQRLLQTAEAYATASTFVALVGIVAAKLAAINLLPLPLFNGGMAVAVLARRLGSERWWPQAVSRTLIVLYVGCVLSWLLAVGVFFVQRAG